MSVRLSIPNRMSQDDANILQQIANNDLMHYCFIYTTEDDVEVCGAREGLDKLIDCWCDVVEDKEFDLFEDRDNWEVAWEDPYGRERTEYRLRDDAVAPDMIDIIASSPGIKSIKEESNHVTLVLWGMHTEFIFCSNWPGVSDVLYSDEYKFDYNKLYKNTDDEFVKKVLIKHIIPSYETYEDDVKADIKDLFDL